MDYYTFDSILQKHGLEDEPAFENVWVQISPLPPIGGHPLGLYYSDPDHQYHVEPGTVWIPPDSDEDTVLHELGHRYGDYHFGNLSEEFAEQYRLSHKPAPVVSYVRDEAAEDDNTTRNLAIAIGAFAVSIMALSKFKR